MGAVATGHYNTSVGYFALAANTSQYNTAVGNEALKVNTSGEKNVAVGCYALDANTTADYNTAVGYYGLKSNTTGEGNTSIGYHSGADITTASDNTLIGREAGDSISTGSNNTCVGFNAGTTITTGASNVCIGYQAGQNQIDTGAYAMYLARNASGAGNAGVWIHGNSSGSCYQGDNSSSWTTTSDRRLKKNITDNTKGLAEIEQLRVANFEYRKEEEIDMAEFPLADNPNQVVLGEGNEGVHTGVIAQEIEAILPECIKVSEKGAKTVGTDPILWALVNAVKELSSKNSTLETRIAALEAG